MDDWDWELLHDPQVNENDAKVEDLKKSASSAASSVCDDCGVIRSDYFSLDSHHHHSNKFSDEEEEESSDNPSWIDPSNSMSVAGRRERIRSCSNSDSSDPSDSRNLLLLIEPHSDCADNNWSDSCELGNGNGIGIGIQVDETPISGEFHDAIDDVSVQKMTQVEEEEEEGGKGYESEGDQRRSNSDSGDPNENVVVREEEEERESGLLSVSESNEDKRVVWWKVPLQMLKYFVLRVSPVWSLSMAAAAVMGFVILRRRYLYKMKRKTQGLQLKVTVDDKVCVFPLILVLFCFTIAY